jgi:cell division protein FtsQ
VSSKGKDRPGRVATDPRISRRRAAVERGKRRRLLVGLGALALVVALVWAMFFSPLLEVSELKLLGAEQTTLAEVAEVTRILGSGENLLLLSTGEVESAVETLPWVESAEVDRSLPGTVKVRVVEREAALVLSLGAARWTIDIRGHVLATGEAAEGLPVLAGIQVDQLVPGIQLRTEEAVGALRSYRSLPAVVRRRVAAVFAPTIERISFSLEGGTVIRFGAAEQLKAKNEVLAALFERLGPDGGGVAYIDVRVPTSPAVSGPAASPSPGISPSPVASPSPSPTP